MKVTFNTLRIGWKFKKDGKTWEKSSRNTAKQIAQAEPSNDYNFHFRHYENVELIDENLSK